MDWFQDGVDTKSANFEDVKSKAPERGLLKRIVKAFKTLLRVKLFAARCQSWKINRSYNHVTTILIGPSGAGKSATMKHMLGFNLLDKQTETRGTTEYRVIEPEENLGMSDLSVSIVNTPGLGDTDGLPQDACNLVSIKQFCHQNLNECKPNVILFVFDATDQRFQGEQSTFFKSLKAFSQLSLVDTEKPNVIVIMTHVCTIPYKKVDCWKWELTKIADSVKNMIKQTLHIEPPVVFLENAYERCGLKMSGRYQSRLPDGTWQPNNLFFAIADLLRDNKDILAVETFKHFYKTSEQEKNIEVYSSCRAKIAKEDQLDSEETKLLNALKNEAIKGGQLPEIITKANEFMTTNGWSLTEEKKRHIKRIANVLVEKLGMISHQDLNKNSIEIISNLIANEPLSSFEVSVLKDVYKLEPKLKEPAVFLSVGSGYNILTDEIKPAYVFKQNYLLQSFYGINLLKGMTVTKVSESRTYTEYYKDEADYAAKRLKQLGVNVSSADLKMFQMKSKGGFISKSAVQAGNLSPVEISFLHEKRMFRIDLCDLEALQVSEKFQKDVLSIPVKYDKTDPRNRADFKDFFDYWGHFVVSSAYGGGNLEIDGTIRLLKDLDDKGLFDAKAELEMGFRNIICGFQFNYDPRKIQSESPMLSTSHLKWSGGDSQHHVVTMNQMTPEKWKLWEDSVDVKPSCLATEMSLIPIYDIVDRVDPPKKLGCREALYDLLFVSEFQTSPIN